MTHDETVTEIDLAGVLSALPVLWGGWQPDLSVHGWTDSLTCRLLRLPRNAEA
jgi:hypothetical protein